MSFKKILIVFAVVGLSFFNLAVQSAEPDCYDLEGAWLASYAAGSPFGIGASFLVTYHSIGNQNNRWSFVTDDLVGDPKIWHPEAVSSSSFHGIMVKTGVNRFEGTSVGYALGAQGQVLLLGYVNSVTIFKSCNTFVNDARVSLYLPEQDADKDGLPDSGQQPIQCVPILWNMNRVQLIPPCSPIQAHDEVWVTDDLQSTQDLVGSVDEDLDSERALVIRWNLDSQDAKEYHVYVSVDGGKYLYLGHTNNKNENYYEWKPGIRKYQNYDYSPGPQSGMSYSFMIYTVTASGKPLFMGPFKTKGAVAFQVKSEMSDKETLLNAMYQSFNAHDLQKAFELFTDDVVYDSVPLNQVLHGKEAVIAFFNGMFQSFPDFQSMRTRLLYSAADNIIVTETTVTGTHLGEFLGIPATGKSIQFKCLFVWEFTGNKIFHITEYTDAAVILTQLGVMPPSEPLKAPTFKLPKPVPNQMTPVEGLKEAYARWNNHDLLSKAELFRLDVQCTGASVGAPLNRDQNFAMEEIYQIAFPDIHSDFIRIIELNDGWALGEMNHKGTFAGPFLGIPATGNVCELRGATLLHFDDNGLVVDYPSYMDSVTLMKQMGILQ